MGNQMMKYGLAILIFFSGSVYADDSVVCTHGAKERVISVVYDDPSSKVPCEVQYQKDGELKTLWRAVAQAGYCEEKAQGLVQKQIGWGWQCAAADAVAAMSVEEGASSSEAEAASPEAEVGTAVAE